MKVRSAVAGAAVALVLAVAPPASAAVMRPANANPQDHCNGVVCIGAESYDGDGNLIINATVETRGPVPVAPGTVFYLNYGPNPTAAKKSIPRWCIAESNNVGGCTFGIGQYLNVGWVLCGQIIYHVGYPCITIGREDDAI